MSEAYVVGSTFDTLISLITPRPFARVVRIEIIISTVTIILGTPTRADVCRNIFGRYRLPGEKRPDPSITAKGLIITRDT